MVFGTGSSIPESDIPIYLGETSSYLMATAMTGENLIRQAIAIQTLNQVSAEFATAVAYQERYLDALSRINMLDFGRGGTLNSLKAVILVVFVGLVPIMALMFITPLGRKIFYVFITIPMWLAMWAIAETSVVTMSTFNLQEGV